MEYIILHYVAYSKAAHLFSDICYGCRVMGRWSYEIARTF
jgi:hypothetical protein